MAWEHILTEILLWFGLYSIVAISLNIEYGYAGIPNFGRALAVLIGAIAVGGITNRILIAIFNVTGSFAVASGIVKTTVNEIVANNPIFGISLMLISLVIAGILGVIVGAIFILPSAKLSEDYLAITLLAISEVAFMVSYYNPEIIGGYYGVSTPDFFAFVSGEYRVFVFMGVILFVALIVYLFAERLLNTPYGRILKAMRENEDVVKSYGRDIMFLRIKTVAIGSGIASLAGALYSMFTANVIASSFSRVEWTFYPFLMILLGGLGNNRGVLMGVLAFVVAKVLLTTYKYEIRAALNLPFEAVWLEYILFGVVAILILYYKPEGLIKEKPIVTKPIRERKSFK
ncbi:MAG: branched-chain amino acid ABC transporter permease [Archaeoglobales archaeon]|nr:MAG: branched-chain amino acid ABC transporter permease [Archaeoglobales archaeon]